VTDYTGLEGGTVRERLRAVGVSLSLAIVGAVVGIGTLLVAATVLTAMGVSLAELVAVRYGVTVLSLQGVGFIVTVAAFLKAKDRFDLIRSRIPTLRDVGMIVGGVVGLLALLIGISALVAYLGLETPEPQLVEEGLENPEVMLLLIPLAYLFIGPGEELMFRGAVQGLLREAYAPVPAIVLASAIFALAHVTNVITAPGQQITIYLAVIFALSLLLGALYEYTENLVVPAFVHATYDAILFLSIYAQGSGMVG
jgi:membrane protease YdiL (CAAX protease family)